MQHYNHSQFKTLVQHELLRIQSLINDEQPRSIYPISGNRYVQQSRRSTLLKRQPSTYHGLFSFIQKVRFMMF